MNSAAILCALLLLAPPDSNWERFISTPKVFRSDHPKAHPLAYFRLEPCARKDDAPISECVSGTPDTQRRLVGRIDRFMVYDLDTYFSTEADPDAVERKVDRKSILVQSGSGQYREI